jgi:uncharacterized protein (TIGR03435 family)
MTMSTVVTSPCVSLLALRAGLVALGCVSMLTGVLAQAPPPAADQQRGVAYDAVAIRRNAEGLTFGSIGTLPDGTFRLMNSTLSQLVSVAYPDMADYVGLPEWVQAERYDVTAKSALTNPSPEERRAMMRGLLADRFRFVAHTETREKPTFDLILARSDGRLGRSMQRSDVACDTPAPRGAALGKAAPAGSTVPLCSWAMTLDAVEGDITMASLARLLGTYAERHVIDKTGLTGSYRIKLSVGLMSPELSATAIDSPPTVFTALSDLGLKLQSSRALLDVLVIDRMERPSEN